MKKGIMASPDARALRLANELRRRLKRKAAKLKAQRPDDLEQLDREERARLTVKAVRRRLKDAISLLETRRVAFSRLVERLSRDGRL